MDNKDVENVVLTWQVKSSLIACEAIIKSALMRQESRGAHYRSDFPKLDDQTWKINIYCRNDVGRRRGCQKWYCLNRMLKKSRDRWQIILKNTSKQNIIENSNNVDVISERMVKLQFDL